MAEEEEKNLGTFSFLYVTSGACCALGGAARKLTAAPLALLGNNQCQVSQSKAKIGHNRGRSSDKAG